MLPYYEVVNLATTVAEGPTELRFHRMPNSRTLRLTGTIAAGAEPETLRLGIDDPAHFAAWRLRTLLEARGVRVTGETQARHRPFTRADDPAHRSGPPPPRPPEPEALARLTPPPLAEDLTQINKVSQNLHAELMLRRLGLIAGSGSIEDGVAAIAAMMERAGVPRTAWDLSDGSGMSTYNRLSPRAVATLLRWAAAQPWGAAWRATFPVAGVDGTLARRFRGTPLEGRLFAKTGTLNATNALSGYMTARSGRTLIFSFYANDVPGDAGATEVMDRTLDADRGGELGRIPGGDHRIAGRAAQLHDAGLAMAGRVDAVGEQRPGEAAIEIHPKAGAGEAGMADRLVGAGIAAVPAVEAPLPAAGAVLVHRRADRLEHERRGAAAVEQAGGEAEHAGHRAEQAGMTRRAAQRPGILVMDLTLHDTAAPGAGLGGDRGAGRRAEAQARAERPMRRVARR